MLNSQWADENLIDSATLMIAILELVLAAEDFSIDTQKRRIKLTNCYHRYFQINLYKKSSLSGVLRKKKPTQ